MGISTAIDLTETLPDEVDIRRRLHDGKKGIVMTSTVCPVDRRALINRPIMLAPNWATAPLAALAGHLGVARVAWEDGATILADGNVSSGSGRRSPSGEKRSAPLSMEARRRLQADVDTIGDLFVSPVARYRGRSSEAIRAQQAATYLGAAAVQAGAPPAAQWSVADLARQRRSLALGIAGRTLAGAATLKGDS
jgi:hypothetical protein